MSTERIILIRKTAYKISTKKVLTFWHAGGIAFAGQGCHMRALSHARKLAQKG